MTTLTYQRILARLVVDDRFHEAYRNDRDHVIASLGLEAREAFALRALDASDLDVFRDVVRGSRIVQFRMFFASLAARVGLDALDDLVDRFQSDVVVHSSRDCADAVAFVGWLAGEAPGSAALELATYDLCKMRIQSPLGNTPIPGTLQRAVCVQTLVLARDLPTLLDPEADLDPWAASPEPPGICYVLAGTPDSDDVQVLEANALVTSVLGLLSRPRTPGAVQRCLGMSASEAAAVLEELVAAGLVVAHG